MKRSEHNFGDSGDSFRSLYFNDFDYYRASPLGRLGASRPPAAGVGFPDKTGRGRRFEEL